jgi:hypothetical protein
MSDQAIDAAVEKILSDPDYAAQVHANPESALTSQFDLAPEEWRSIGWSLQQDVQNSLGDVQGYDGYQFIVSHFPVIRFDFIRQVPTFRTNFDRADDDVPTKHNVR